MSRNSSGTYTLPAGNPVVSATTISTTWANTTLGDFATEITDSASRSGKGGFTAPVRGVDGSAAAPAVSFTSEPGTGLYKSAAGEFAIALLGALAAKLTTAGLALTSTVGITIAGAARAFVQALGTNAPVQLLGNRNATDTAADIELSSTATRTAGKLVSVINNGVEKVYADYQGLLTLGSQAGSLQPASIYTAVTPGTNIAATGASYFKDACGIVHVQGFVSGSGAAIVNGTVMFNLPAGFRPSDPRQFVAIDSSRNLFGVQVAVNGDVTLIAPVVVNTSGATSIANSGPVLYLDVIQFLARA